MTKATAFATRAKTGKPAASPSRPPKMETPEAFREIAGKGVADANATHEKTKVAAEQAADLLKNTYATAAKGAADFNLKVLEIARTNTSTAFDYARELFGAKSLPELVELSSAHARKQFAAMTTQTRELTKLAVKVTTGIAEPLKTGVTKAFNTQAA